jgi:hypothetical protein
VDVLAQHPVLAAASVSGASSAAGIFIARAVRAQRPRVRALWASLAALELGIAIGIIRAVVARRRSQRTGD